MTSDFYAGELRDEIATAINRHSAENRSNTPDFILAKFLTECLRAFDEATVRRASWYGIDEEERKLGD